ncbi:MAG: MarR family transcriptional regulator [Acidimicrobiia bacterium]|nr:MarR family transcriptional regulator [Acidimicrobiia bacterium]
MNGAREEAAGSLWLSVARLARRLRQESMGDLTPSQRSVLATLDRRGPLRMGELASIEGVSRPSITGIIGRLEGSGLVTREPSPEDARSTIVRLTAPAREILDTTSRRRSAFLAKRMTHLSDEEVGTLAKVAVLLDKIAAGE